MAAPAFIAEVFRYFLAFLLFFAALGKYRTFVQFQSNLVESLGLGRGLSAWLAPALVGMEFGLSLLIVAGIAISYYGMLAALLLFACFTAFIGYKYVKEGIVKCSCFGESERSVSGFDLLRNVLVILSAAFYLAFAGAAGLAWPALLTAAALALILTVLAIEFHDLAMLLVHSSKGYV